MLHLLSFLPKMLYFKKLTLKESYEEEEIFCYVYQTQRKCSWFCDLFFKNNLVSLIVHNILIELGNIGFEKKLNENLENKEISQNIITIVYYLSMFIFFIIAYTKACFFNMRKKNFNNFSTLATFFYTYIIIISGFSAFNKKKLKSVTDDWLIVIPLAYTKYINFLVLDKLISIIDEENIDVLSNSFIITSIFFTYDILVFFVTDIIDCDSDNLILFQFIVGIIIVLFGNYNNKYLVKFFECNFY